MVEASGRPGGATETEDEILRRSAMFHEVDADDVQVLARQFSRLDLPRGEVLFREGDPGDSLYVVLSGKIKLGRSSPGGRETLAAVLGPADQFGELSVFDPGPRTATATAVTDTRLARLPASALHDWIRDRPVIGIQLIRVLAHRLRRTNSLLTDINFVDVPGRLAKQLLVLAQRFGSDCAGRTHVAHDLTQEELAQLVGASRETVNKSLAYFTARGWVRVEGRSVTILDRDRLVRRAR